MRNPLRSGFLQVSTLMYGLIRPLVFRRSAQQSHDDMMSLCSRLDRSPVILKTLGLLHRLAFVENPVVVGGVALPYGFILAAGLVKGVGFETEDAALCAARQGENIIPGWRSVSRLVGPVEFGSFTRWPRLGNSGVVVWRDPKTCSTQNRVGLRNPGAIAAAEFLMNHKGQLPQVFGINIAVSPGVADPVQEAQEVVDSVKAFVSRGVYPGWFTLNLSCPNTEDDPGNHQTESKTRMLCRAIMEYLRDQRDKTQVQIPLWVKVSPDLHESQYAMLMRVFHETGVRAVVATNTLPSPVPGDTGTLAGIGGGRLHSYAVQAVRALSQEKSKHGYTVDIIGCGGVQDRKTYHAFTRYGVVAVQYWSGLVYRGPLVAAHLC